MKLRDLSADSIVRRLKTTGLRLRTGPVVTHVRSVIPAVAQGLLLHYAEHPVEDDDGFADFHVGVVRPSGPRRWFKTQVQFDFDGVLPFKPLPGDQGFPMLEWGMNWCFANHCHQYLTIHAAVVERCGRAMILPAPPGSGKSTLCAGLVSRGWRLLSDELTVIDPSSACIVPVPRPVSLKNASIEVIRRFAPDAVLGPVVHETTKGSVAHMRPPAESVRNADVLAAPGWVVLPKFVPGAPTRLEPLPKARALMRLISNAFNFNMHGAQGFELLADIVDRCDCFEFSYSQLDDAVCLFTELSEARELPCR